MGLLDGLNREIVEQTTDGQTDQSTCCYTCTYQSGSQHSKPSVDCNCSSSRATQPGRSYSAVACYTERTQLALYLPILTSHPQWTMTSDSICLKTTRRVRMWVSISLEASVTTALHRRVLYWKESNEHKVETCLHKTQRSQLTRRDMYHTLYGVLC